MKWLVWKEYRQNRPMALLTLALLLVPHLIGFYATCRGFGPGEANWKTSLAKSSLVSLVMGQIALALVGGIAIADERADRSAEFQAYLPIRRSKILAGKVLFALAIAALVWLPNLAAIWAVSKVRFPPVPYATELMVLPDIALGGLVFYSVAWLSSSLTTSPTCSVFAGLLAPFLVWGITFCILYGLLGQLLGLNQPLLHQAWWRAIDLMLAPACFAIGAWLYLRRVEP